MSVIEFIQRPGKPLFHLEHYIEGDYIKYNSNSGFISCEKVRLTPQVSIIYKMFLSFCLSFKCHCYHETEY